MKFTKPVRVMRLLKSIPLPAWTGLCVLAAGSLLGCETQLDAPSEAELTLQTKSAVEVLPENARFVSMVNLQAIKRNAVINPLGSDLLTSSRFGGENGARLRDFIEATGFDPDKDLREVYVALSGDGPDKAPSLVMYANFNSDRLNAYVKENLKDHFEQTEYNGTPLYRSREADHGLTFAIANDNMIVASPEEIQVHAMLDRLAGQGAALESNEATMRLIKQAGAGSSWFVAQNFSETTRTPGNESNEMALLSQAVRDLAMSIDASEDGIRGTALMTASTGVSLDDLEALTRGAIASMKAASGEDAHKLQALDDVRIKKSGEQVRVSFAFDNAALGSVKQ